MLLIIFSSSYIWFALKVPSADILGLNTCSTLGNDIPRVSRRTSSIVSTAIIVNWFLTSFGLTFMPVTRDASAVNKVIPATRNLLIEKSLESLDKLAKVYLGS